eukprot:TRINITY_DN10101_c0_g1_i1.p1 TRINITY_DN10101_c0_g1~~TRINITY_DN10101_c0_g1_i1.p1  ORF type:complete len:563 (-),score=93.41 TRINITY_DN10101_c0_g1_i1:32-1720(-)
MFYFTPNILTNALAELATFHFNLSCIRVRGIPMKELPKGANNQTTEKKTVSMYDVRLLYPSNPIRVKKSVQDVVSPLTQPHMFQLGFDKVHTKKELILQWKSIRRGGATLAVACSKVLRVSPLCLRSSPSQCLMKHVRSGKAVALITPDQDVIRKMTNVSRIKAGSPIPSTHILLEHHGDVFVHILHPPLPLAQLPFISCYNFDSSLLRVQGMSALIKSNNLEITHQDPLASIASSKNSKAKKKKKVRKMKNSAFEGSGEKIFGVVDSQNHIVQVTLPTKNTTDIRLSDGGGVKKEEDGAARVVSSSNIVVPCLKRVDRVTRVFPYMKRATVLFGDDGRAHDFQRLIMPLKQFFWETQEHSRDDMQRAVEIVHRLSQFSKANEVCLFPLAKSQTERKEAYVTLWQDLVIFARRLSTLDGHREIQRELERAAKREGVFLPGFSGSSQETPARGMKRKREVTSDKNHTATVAKTEAQKEGDSAWNDLQKFQVNENYRNIGRLSIDEEKDQQRRRGGGYRMGGHIMTNIGKAVVQETNPDSLFHQFYSKLYADEAAELQEFDGRK